MKHPSNTECRGVQTLSKEDFIRYAVLALRDCFVADVRTEKMTRSCCTLPRESDSASA